MSWRDTFLYRWPDRAVRAIDRCRGWAYYHLQGKRR